MPRESRTDKQRRVWDEAAPWYDRQIGLFDRVWWPGGRSWLTTRAGGVVLEVAVGTGLNLPLYDAGVSITGIDLSPAMLERARSRARDLGLAVELEEGDASALPFADASYDTVVCCLGLCSIPSPATAIAEMHRVLAPGGSLLLLDHVGSTFAPLRAGQWLVERATIRLAGEHFTRRQRPLVEAAGFDVVTAERLRLGTVERIHAVKPAAPIDRVALEGR